MLLWFLLMPVFPHNEAFQDAGNCYFKIGTKEINPFRGSDDSNLLDGKKISNLTSKPAFFSVEFPKTVLFL